MNKKLLRTSVIASVMAMAFTASAWAADEIVYDDANHGNSYEAAVFLTATEESNGNTGLGIKLYRGDKKNTAETQYQTEGVQYLTEAEAKKALGELYNDKYAYTVVEHSAEASFNKVLNTTIINDVVAMVEGGQNVYVTGDGVNQPYVINAINNHIKGVTTEISGYLNADGSISAGGGILTTTVTENVPVYDGDGKFTGYTTQAHQDTVDISGYVKDVVNNEAGDAIINYAGDTSTQSNSTIEQAINKNYTNITNNTIAIENIQNEYVTKIEEGADGHTWTVNQTGGDNVTIKDTYVTNVKHSWSVDGQNLVTTVKQNQGKQDIETRIRIGNATINYDGDIGTQNTSTIEQAINKNYTKIENVENNYVTNITDGDYSDRNNHTWNLTQNITVNGETTTQTVTVKDLNTTNKLLATDWLPNADHSGLSDDIRVTLMDTDNNEVHSTIFDVAKASLVGKLTDITGNDDIHSGVRARVSGDQNVTLATLIGESHTEAHKKTRVQSSDSNLVVTAISPLSDDENTAVIYDVQTNPNATYNSVTINSGPVINNEGINMNETKITNLADGVNPTDAVNVRQLDRLGGRLDKVGAGAAALAALHPMDFDPDDKLQFSAGVGNYKGETAAAIGAFYRPTEKVMFSVAGTMGNGENMVNAGVTFALDRKNNVSNSRVAMAHEIKDLRDQVAALTALVSQIAGKGNPLLDTVMFPDVPENHWAYDYVESLQKRGIIEGYPDGNFGGDRSCTRYEYAAMLYRALEKGFPVDGRLLKEFEAELGRIRIDRIKGADDDANKVERVRVNDYEDRDDYGSKLAQVVADAAPAIEEEPAA